MSIKIRKKARVEGLWMIRKSGRVVGYIRFHMGQDRRGLPPYQLRNDLLSFDPDTFHTTLKDAKDAAHAQEWPLR